MLKLRFISLGDSLTNCDLSIKSLWVLIRLIFLSFDLVPPVLSSRSKNCCLIRNFEALGVSRMLLRYFFMSFIVIFCLAKRSCLIFSYSRAFFSFIFWERISSRLFWIVFVYLKNFATLTILMSFTSLIYLPAFVPIFDDLPNLATFVASSVWETISSWSPERNCMKK